MAKGQRDQRPFHEQVAGRLVELLEAGTAPWQRSWEVGEYGYAPMNPSTGKAYRGINSVWLQAQGRSDPRWLTYRQAGELGAQVHRGERGSTIQYWKFRETRVRKDDDGKPILGVDGKPIRIEVPLERPRAFYATVFNAEQIEGLPEIQKREFDWDPIERAQALLQASDAKIIHQGSRACYRLSDDEIRLPPQNSFATAAGYYATALHELGHWTGHPVRLDRDMGHPFGSEAYAREELRAEIASMMLGDQLGIGHDPGQHAAYVQSWIRALREDPMEIFRASADASKIQDFVTGLEEKRERTLATSQEATQSTLMVAPVLREEPGQRQTIPEGDIIEVRSDELVEIRYRYDGQALSHVEPGSTPKTWLVQTATGDKLEIPDNKLEVTSIPLGDEDANIVQHSAKPARSDDSIPRITDVLLALSQERGNLGLGDADSRVALNWFHGERAVRCRSVSDGNARIEYADTRTAAIVPANEILLRNGLTATGRQTFAGVPLSDALVLVRSTGQTQVAKQAAVPRAIPGFDEIAVAAHLTGTNLDFGDVSSRLAIGWSYRGQPVECISTQGATAQIRSSDARIEEVPTAEVRLLNRGVGEVGKGISLSEVLTMTAQSAALTEAEKRTRMTKPTTATPKQYLSVPYRQKRDVKELGARWDRQAKAWYIPANLDKAIFGKWLDGQQPPPLPANSERQYLAVPFRERELAKSAGAKWDKQAKAWYAGEGASAERLARWLPENISTAPEPGMDPQEEFTQALLDMGGVFTPKHPAPIMDGSKHRMKAEGDGNGETAIFYVGHLDGAVPAGYIKNNRTGIEIRWKASGHRLSEDEKVKLRAEAAAQAQAREAFTRAGHEASSVRAQQLVSKLSTPQAPTSYMLQKGISTHKGVLADEEGQTIVPFHDAAGKVWGVQFIKPDGTKRLSKNSRKQGCFHAVGGLEELAKAPTIVIAEGYASAATLAEMLGHPTVAAFDSGNLKAVAQELRSAFPNKALVIAGDDDKHLEQNPKIKINVGRVKAQEAASVTGATLLMPIFAPKEQANDPKGFTDFNDLANHSVLGREGCRGQVLAVVEEALGLQRRRQHTQRKERSRPHGRSI